jgi:hypothetical protein
MMTSSITSSIILPSQIAAMSPTNLQQTAQQDALLSQWLQQKGMTNLQISSLNAQQKAAYLQQMKTSQGAGNIVPGVTNLVNASTNGNPLQSAQQFGLPVPNANSAAMGAIGFNQVNPQAAAIIAQIMRAGASIDPAGTAALAQKISTNASWGLNTNPMIQQVFGEIQQRRF